MVDAYRWIIQAAPDSLEAALEELRFEPWGMAIQQLGSGIALIELEQATEEWLAALDERPPVFVRHLMPVQREIVLDEAEHDLERLAQVAVHLAQYLTPGKAFAVQARIVGDAELPYTRFELNESLSNAIEADTQAELNVPEPYDVLSLVVAGDRAYMGVSPVTVNRSAWAGGAQRFAREADQISRAEFKLLEAQAVFDFRWPDWGKALDLGAAPGGWTRLLRRAGLPVVAVDPAKLDQRIVSDPLVTYVPLTAQRYLPTDERFSVVVNDIRMDARDSAWLMKDLAYVILPGGLAVVTLKLPHEDFARITYRALGILRSAYSIIGARQLFHNRSEVTVVLRPLEK